MLKFFIWSHSGLRKKREVDSGGSEKKKGEKSKDKDAAPLPSGQVSESPLGRRAESKRDFQYWNRPSRAGRCWEIKSNQSLI